MKTKTKVKAGSLTHDHNEAQVRDAAPGLRPPVADEDDRSLRENASALDERNTSSMVVPVDALRAFRSGSDTLTDHDLTVIAFGHASLQYLYSACQLHLFEFLEANPEATAESIRSELSLNERPTRCLLSSLKSLKLLVKVGSGYRNSLTVSALLSSQLWWNMFIYLLDFHAKIAYLGVADLLESLRADSNVGLRRLPGNGKTLYERFDEYPEIREVFYRYMGAWSRFALPLLLEGVDFRRYHRILDVGGGDGSISLALATRNPDAIVTMMELPGNSHVAREAIRRQGLGERVRLAEGDFFESEFPAGNDCVLFAHQLVIWSPERIRVLLRKAHDALVPGGEVLIFSSIADADGPVMAALDSSYFLAIPAEGGMIYGWDDYRELLTETGFSQMNLTRCGSWTPHGIVRATR
jgi:L-tyrosine C(3)-methyltransferase